MPFDGKPEQFTESETAQDLRAALALFGPNGEKWAKVDMRDAFGNMCAAGALDQVQRECWPRRIAMFRAFSKAALGNPIGLSHTIGEWNDAPERTWDDVKAAFERAIELAK